MTTGRQREAGEAELRAQVGRLQEEVLRLQQRLGALHATDLNSLRRAYATLCQHVEALEGEASGMTAALREFETEVVPPQLVAKELGVAAALAFGLGLLRATVRALPLRAAQSPAVTRGLWLLGGAVVLSRLTGGAVAHVAALMGRNRARQRRLLRQLDEVQERISIMAALQQWSDPQTSPSPAAAAQEEAGGGAEGEGGGQPGGSPPPRASPASSSGGSGELVERPEYDEEVEAAEGRVASGSEATAPPVASASAGAGRDRAGSQAGGGGQRSGARAAETADPALASLAKYAQLGDK